MGVEDTIVMAMECRWDHEPSEDEVAAGVETACAALRAYGCNSVPFKLVEKDSMFVFMERPRLASDPPYRKCACEQCVCGN